MLYNMLCHFFCITRLILLQEPVTSKSKSTMRGETLQSAVPISASQTCFLYTSCAAKQMPSITLAIAPIHTTIAPFTTTRTTAATTMVVFTALETVTIVRHQSVVGVWVCSGCACDLLTGVAILIFCCRCCRLG
jgi:hypothetical protein